MSHKRTNSTEVAWYTDAIGPKLGATARQILEGYGKIPANQLESHVSKIVSPIKQSFLSVSLFSSLLTTTPQTRSD